MFSIDARISSLFQNRSLNTNHAAFLVEVYHPFNLHPQKWFEGYTVKSTHIFLGCSPNSFWFISMTPNFLQAAALKKFWVEATLKKSQVAPFKNLGRFYRVNHFSGCRLNGCITIFIKLKNLYHFSHLALETSVQCNRSLKFYWLLKIFNDWQCQYYTT